MHARRFVEWSVDATHVDAVPFTLTDGVDHLPAAEARWLDAVARRGWGRVLTLPFTLQPHVAGPRAEVAEYELRERALPEDAIVYVGLNVESAAPLQYRVLYLSRASTRPQLLPERLAALALAAVSLTGILVIVLW